MLRNKLFKHAGRCLTSAALVSTLFFGNAAFAHGGGHHDGDSKHHSSFSDWTQNVDTNWDQQFDVKWNDAPAHSQQHSTGSGDVAFFLFLPDTFDTKDLFKLVNYASHLDENVNIFAFIGKVDYQQIFSAWTNVTPQTPVPAPVPEPATVGLMAGGLGLLGFMAKRRPKL